MRRRHGVRITTRSSPDEASLDVPRLPLWRVQLERGLSRSCTRLTVVCSFPVDAVAIAPVDGCVEALHPFGCPKLILDVLKAAGPMNASSEVVALIRQQV